MNSLTFRKALSHRLLGALGVGMLLGGLAPSAMASNILLGSDYLYTPDNGGTSFDFGRGIGIVKFKGVPLGGFGLADTIIERRNDAIFDSNRDGILEQTSATINIEMTKLSLISASPVLVGTNYYNVKPSLNSTPSKGTMTITHNTTNLGGGKLGFNDGGASQGTFSSLFNVNFDAIFTPVSAGNPFTVPNLSIALINPGASWSHAPTINSFLKRGSIRDQLANCHQLSGSCAPGDFFPGPVAHAKGSPNYPAGHGTTVAPNSPTPICDPILVSTALVDAVLQPTLAKCTTVVAVKSTDAEPSNETSLVSQTPGPLSFLGASTAFAFTRRLRQRCLQAMA